MEEVKKVVEIPGMNPLVKRALDQQIKQLKQLQGMLGKPALQKQINATPMNQAQKDYVYAQMGWL
jgi:hypothetical protein